MKVLPLTVLFLTLIGCSAGDMPLGAAQKPGAGASNAAIDALFAPWDVPGSAGCGLAIARRGEVIYSRGYGYANLDYDIPITPQSIFDIASVTKQFTAASIIMLAEDGKLSLDDDVRKWLPELPAYEWPITLRHMLQHTSGLRDYLALFPLAGRDDYYPISHPQILAMMARQRDLVSEPGERYAYSNTAYMLLSQVVERVSGQTLGEFTAERIFEPLGMSSSFMYENVEAIIPGRSIGYFNADDGQLRVVHNYNFDVAGDGQMYTSMTDLLIWDDYLHGPEKPQIHEKMLAAGTLNNGEALSWSQGLRRGQYRGQTTIGHSGSSWGFRTELVRFVEAGLTVAISCNMDNIHPGRLAEQVADHYLAAELAPKEPEQARTPPPEPESATPIALSPAQLEAFTGAYFSPELDAVYRLALNNGELVLRIEQEPATAAVAMGADRFEALFQPGGLYGSSTLTLEFDRNRAGEVIGFGLSRGSIRGVVFEKGVVR